VFLVDNIRISGDLQRLQRVMANILDNAIKYTPRFGRITINVMISNNFVNIIFRDTGIGIPRMIYLEYLIVFIEVIQADPKLEMA